MWSRELWQLHSVLQTPEGDPGWTQQTRDCFQRATMHSTSANPNLGHSPTSCRPVTVCRPLTSTTLAESVLQPPNGHCIKRRNKKQHGTSGMSRPDEPGVRLQGWRCQCSSSMLPAAPTTHACQLYSEREPHRHSRLRLAQGEAGGGWVGVLNPAAAQIPNGRHIVCSANRHKPCRTAGGIVDPDVIVSVLPAGQQGISMQEGAEAHAPTEKETA